MIDAEILERVIAKAREIAGTLLELGCSLAGIEDSEPVKGLGLELLDRRVRAIRPTLVAGTEEDQEQAISLLKLALIGVNVREELAGVSADPVLGTHLEEALDRVQDQLRQDGIL
jgi:hypothetical protein